MRARPIDWGRRDDKRSSSSPQCRGGACTTEQGVVFGIVATSVATSRRDAARSVSASSEPQLVRAESLYASLSDADATAATTFLTGGVEPATRRARYLADINAASARLAELSRGAGTSSDIRAAVASSTPTTQAMPGYRAHYGLCGHGGLAI
jgi:hypothetical protein